MDNNISMMDVNAPEVSGSPPTANSFLEGLKNISFLTWMIIILIFAFLGFNVFVYLAEGTQDITNILKPLFGKILGLLGITIKEVVDISAEGTRTIVDGTAKVVDKVTTNIQDAVDKPFEEAEAKKKAGATNANAGATPSSASSSVPNSQVQRPPGDVMQANTLNKALNTAVAGQGTAGDEYQADDSTSSIQHGGSKSGWCYIGEDRGFRTCAQVGADDTCLSGDIFPSQEICINPNLRP